MREGLMNLAKKIGLGLLFILVGTLALLIIIVIIIRLNSPGVPKPFLDSDGKRLQNCISEKGCYEIDGANIHFIIKGKDSSNIILLYLHGGMPDYFLTQRYPAYLEEIFTVVWLDQRGAGMSYQARYPDAQSAIDALISDVKAVTEYLQRRFSQEKIYLMAIRAGRI